MGRNTKNFKVGDEVMFHDCESLCVPKKYEGMVGVITLKNSDSYTVKMKDETRWSAIDRILKTPFSEEGLPADWMEPEWDKWEKIHCWRNHVGTHTRNIYSSLSLIQKKAICLDAKTKADEEEWD